MDDAEEQRKLDWLYEALRIDPAEALADAETRRMTLATVRHLQGYKARLMAKNLGVSIFAYHRLELGWEPLSREMFVKAMAFLDMTPARLDYTLRLIHKLMFDLADAWPKIWRERLETLDAEARRALILQDKTLHNGGLGGLLCDKSFEAADPDEALSLAELAVLVMEKAKIAESFHRRRLGYARGHLGHALQRRGDRAAAESAFAQAIEQWMTGEGSQFDNKEQAERLATIVPGFSKTEALKRKRRTRRVSRPQRA